MFFIANFHFLTDQQQDEEQERRHGTFSMIVQASDAQEALEEFKNRLIRFRSSSAMFSGKCSIYIQQLLEFEQFPTQEAVLINLKSFVGDPVLPYISCSVPTEQNNACSIQEWSDNQPVSEGQPDSRFIEFG